jgi:CheY-like chemotaxis protein/two-component sensor histidine kinase
MMSRQVRQLSRIVDDLVDISSLVQKKITLRKERIPVSSVVDTAVETCRPMIEAFNHQLTVTLPPEPLYIYADSIRISQVLINLLNNACKFTNPGGHIWITVERTERKLKQVSPDGEVALRVRDTGIGIAPAVLPHIFELFSQGDTSLERERGGLGIGLSLVQTLVNLHGGAVEVYSAGSGQGSEFIVYLPLVLEEAEGKPKVEKEKREAKRVLVIDDNQDQANSLGMLLKVMGHEVSVAYNGQMALELVEEFTPQIAMVDIGLPGMNGYEVGRRLKDKFPGVILVAQTGWGQERDRRKSQEAGFDYHLVKPINPESLKNILSGKSTS